MLLAKKAKVTNDQLRQMVAGGMTVAQICDATGKTQAATRKQASRAGIRLPDTRGGDRGGGRPRGVATDPRDEICSRVRALGQARKRLADALRCARRTTGEETKMRWAVEVELARRWLGRIWGELEILAKTHKAAFAKLTLDEVVWVFFAGRDIPGWQEAIAAAFGRRTSQAVRAFAVALRAHRRALRDGMPRVPLTATRRTGTALLDEGWILREGLHFGGGPREGGARIKMDPDRIKPPGGYVASNRPSARAAGTELI